MTGSRHSPNSRRRTYALGVISGVGFGLFIAAQLVSLQLLSVGKWAWVGLSLIGALLAVIGGAAYHNIAARSPADA